MILKFSCVCTCCYVYADDTIVLAEDEVELQKALSSVKEYCETWKLNINVAKTKVVIFSRGKLRNFPVFKYGDDKVEVTDEYIYLGINFSCNGRMEKAIKKQVTQARRALFSMMTKSK